MRVAVIADIHSDLSALERVLSAIERADADETWCLGDIVGLGGSSPAEVIDLVREYSALILSGNHDRWVTGQLPLDMLPLPAQRAELQWQRAQLSTGQLEWLSGLGSHAQRGDVELWHGSGEDPITGWVSTESDAAAHLARQTTPIGLVGHTHRAMIARLEDARVHWREHPIREDLGSSSRVVLNPGAVTGTHRWLELDVEAGAAVWHSA